MNGLLLKAEKVVLPASLTDKVIKMSHRGHLGAKLCKRLIKDNYFFPLIDKLVDEEVNSCEACDANRDITRLNPIISSPMPQEKWDLISIDLSSRTPSGEYILVLVCEHSRYPVLKLSNYLTSRETIRILKKVFDEFDYPNSIKSDNGPAFKSREFASFCQQARITHVKVTPLWPRANGEVHAEY